MTNEFELIVRALIIREKKILVCQTVGRDYFFLPGGHIEYSENMKDALSRELYEELGARVVGSQFIGGIENLFTQDGETRHEISFMFHVDIDLEEIVSKEEHVSFYWFTYDEFINQNIVPPAIKDAVMQWVAERKPFFIQEGTDR